jgi:ADP-ribosyl-[dinitrogen reductase] hydrolase
MCLAAMPERVSYSLSAVRERARAAFLGLALGDALGAPLEFMTAGEIRTQHGTVRELIGGGWLRLAPGRVTDDTEMSVVLARAIVEQGGFDLRAAAEALAGWLKGNPIDAGDTVRRGLRAFIVSGRLEAPENDWDAGNGAAMRMVPVALATLGDPGLLARTSLAQARLTHHHPLSDAGCVALGRMLQAAVLGLSRPRLRREADALVATHPTFRFEPWRGLTTGYVVDTLQTVFHHFFGAAGLAGLEDCLVAVVNAGGDADTAGAIAGALAGAYHGLEALPRRWLRRLDPALVADVERLADALVALSPLGRAPVDAAGIGWTTWH